MACHDVKSGADAPCRIETPAGTAWRDEEDIIWIRVNEGRPLDGQAMEQLLDAQQALVGQRGKLPAVILNGGITDFSRGARRLLEQRVSPMTECLAVVPNRPVALMITRFLLRVAPIPIPARVASSEAEALAWVRAIRSDR